MPKVPSPYSVETLSGTLELSKGAYLTMLKRKGSAVKTLCKSKQTLSGENSKPTLKKSKKINGVNPYDKKWMKYSAQDAVNSHSFKKAGKMFRSLKHPAQAKSGIQIWSKEGLPSQVFQLWNDEELFDIPGIPTIEMDMDNDEESTWTQVWEHSHVMAMNLSMAAYDRTYGN